MLLIASAVGKLLDNRGFAIVISTYQLIPEFLTLGAGLAFSLVELAIGLFLLKGAFLYRTSQLVILLHLFYTALAIFTLLRGIKLLNCGCFGVFWVRPLTIETYMVPSRCAIRSSSLDKVVLTYIRLLEFYSEP